MPSRARTPVEIYIDGFPEPVRKLLRQLRDTIRKTVPESEEVIGYGMPTYKLYGKNLVHFAGYKHHIGLYPAPSGMHSFREELSRYVHSKGAVRFPLDQPLPLDLVRRIVQFRAGENKGLAAPKKREPRAEVCPQGHRFVKTGDCPVCPQCAQAQKPESGWLALLSAPARRALETAGIRTPKQLAGHTEAEILSLHGIGRASLPAFRQVLEDAGLAFRPHAPAWKRTAAQPGAAKKKASGGTDAKSAGKQAGERRKA